MITSTDVLSAGVFARKGKPPSTGRSFVLITAEHVVAGSIDTGDMRLSEVLNKIDTSYVRVGDVGLFDRAENKRITTLRECVVSKAKLELAVTLDGEHEAPHKRQYRFVEKETVPVFLTVHGYEVRGKLPLERVGQSEPDPVWILTQRTPQFFPVVQATVSRVGDDPQPLQVPVAIVNTDSVAMFAVGWETDVARGTGSAAEGPGEGAFSTLERLQCCRERNSNCECLRNLDAVEAVAARPAGANNESRP